MKTQLFNRTTRSVSLTQVGFQFLPDAQQMLGLYYHSLEWISTFHKHKRTVLRIGYADSHANWFISKILSCVLADNENIVPELTLDQTDANLHRLTTSQLDLVLGIKDAKFTAEGIAFQKLHDDAFVCVMRKNHPLALAGAGFALIPQHLTLPHKELIFLPWEESPHAPMGIYYHQQGNMDKNSAIYKFITLARECANEAMPCNKQ